MTKTIPINLPASPHDIIIEAGALRRLGEIVASVAPHAKAMLAIDAAIDSTHAPIAEKSLREAGFDVSVHSIVADERHKSLATVESMYQAMLGARLERGSPVVALGGGVVGDTAGLAAATFLRGVPFIQAPTTLLAMVDASIGGKTGVNAPLPGGGVGKNLIGAFWQPRAVVIDPQTLCTLDARMLRCGLAECIKHGVIADAGLLAFIREKLDTILALDMRALTDLIERSANIKVEIVCGDERESGPRSLLNLGHTFAHVIEPLEELHLQHGEAVAIGLCAAARTAVLTGRLKESEAEEIESLLRAVGLPVRLPSPVEIDPLMVAMSRDKKVAAGRVRLVLPRGLGAAELADDVQKKFVREAWVYVAG